MRWEVTGIPDGESGDYKVEQCTTTTGEPSWLNYVNYRNISEGDYTVLYRKFGESWLNIMQDTQQEYGEHDWLVERMSGDVLLGGLGIGMIHIPLLDSDDVTSVTIVEKEQDVIDLVWEHCARDERFSIVHADINTWTPPEEVDEDGNPIETRWDVVWMDTWLTHEETLGEYSSRMREKCGPHSDNVGGWQWPD